MKRKSIALLSTILAGAVVLTGCGTKKDDTKKSNDAAKTVKANEVKKATEVSKLPQVAKDRKDTLIVGGDAPKGKFNPLYSDSVYDGYITDLIFEGLITNDAEGNPIPALASKWDISNDGKTYTFTLVDGAKFSDGTEVTADDVAFTYTAFCDPKYDGPRVDAVEKLQGYKEYKEGTATSVSGIKVIDKKTVSFTLTQVKGPGIYDFAYGILPKAVYNFEKGNMQKIKDSFLKPVGAGEFKFVEFKQGESVTLEKNDKFYKGAPKIAKIIYKVTNDKTNVQELSAGQVDVNRITANANTVKMVQSAGFLDQQIFTANNYNYIGLNTRLPMFSDKKVRQALMYGLRRDEFVQSYYQGYGTVANTHNAPTSWVDPTGLNEYKYDVDKANKLLDEAGWKMNDSTKIREKDGKPFEIHWLATSDNKMMESLIPIVKEDWKKLGINVITDMLDFNTVSEKVYDKQDFQMYAMGWSLSVDPDPSGIFAKSQDTLGGYNSVGWHPDKSEELIAKGLGTTKQDERKAAYQEWTKLINDEVPYLFIVNPKQVWGVSSRVKGMEISAFRDWTYDAYKAELVDPTAK
ncbi:peptide ABC transporter [Clostridium sp. YIM B02505]|uniref:Peptide ABC transporter n=1 Tax=Clostridium yunnanense TaxID=2800325 RepID=A0ABS1EI54_9CLOT|nr:ABC transporter substrate-binding protein [Clostridium yunnanense]MBK1809051.1 peptide ABC transporter [Clostridium yunnanense]